MADTLATNLIGQEVSWSDERGYHSGVVVAVGLTDAGNFTILVSTDRGLVQKLTSGVHVGPSKRF